MAVLSLECVIFYFTNKIPGYHALQTATGLDIFPLASINHV